MRITQIILIVLVLVGAFMLFANRQNARMPTPVARTFCGEYSRDGVTWQTLTEQSDLSAAKGDLSLRGHLDIVGSEDIQLYAYVDHISYEIDVNGSLWHSYAESSTEQQRPAGLRRESLCGRKWVAIPTEGLVPEDLIEIHLQNPHAYGNEAAYRTLLNHLYGVSDIQMLQNMLSAASSPLRAAGSAIFVLSLLLLGAAASAAAMRAPIRKAVCHMGFLAAWAGGYLLLDNVDYASYATVLSLSTFSRQSLMMLYSLWISLYALDALTERRKLFGQAIFLLSALLDGVIWMLSITGTVLIYDTTLYWVIGQLVFCAALLFVCGWELRVKEKYRSLTLLSSMVLLTALVLDIANVGDGFFTHAICSKVAFIAVFLLFCIRTVVYVIGNYQASIRAEAMKKELEESRISIMLSQIQPHFLYNALTTIKYLCRKQDPRTENVVASFSKYLRGNMDSLSIRVPIPFDSELSHLEYYLSIEKLRFPGVSIAFDIGVRDFMLPALTIQPLVENAIRYGVTQTQSRTGTVTLSTWQDEATWFVRIADDGVGFDPQERQFDGRSHIGLSNTRKRLKVMCNATLNVESTPGVGTTITITLPKENHV